MTPQLLDEGDQEGCCLAAAGAGHDDGVSAREDNGEGGPLHWGGDLVACEDEKKGGAGKLETNGGCEKSPRDRHESKERRWRMSYTLAYHGARLIQKNYKQEKKVLRPSARFPPAIEYTNSLSSFAP